MPKHPYSQPPVVHEVTRHAPFSGGARSLVLRVGVTIAHHLTRYAVETSDTSVALRTAFIKAIDLTTLMASHRTSDPQRRRPSTRHLPTRSDRTAFLRRRVLGVLGDAVRQVRQLDMGHQNVRAVLRLALFCQKVVERAAQAPIATSSSGPPRRRAPCRNRHSQPPSRPGRRDAA